MDKVEGFINFLQKLHSTNFEQSLHITLPHNLNIKKDTNNKEDYFQTFDKQFWNNRPCQVLTTD